MGDVLCVQKGGCWKRDASSLGMACQMKACCLHDVSGSSIPAHGQLLQREQPISPTAQFLMVSWCKCVASFPLDAIPASKHLRGSLCQSLYLPVLDGFLSTDLSGHVPKPRSICSGPWQGGLLCAESPPHVYP